MPLMIQTIRGHLCTIEVFARHAFALDVEVVQCSACPGLVGKCFRVSGGAL